MNKVERVLNGGTLTAIAWVDGIWHLRAHGAHETPAGLSFKAAKSRSLFFRRSS